MTDPHSAYKLDNVTFSDTTETKLASPAIAISSVPDGRRGGIGKATNQGIAYTISNRDAEPAYAANPSPDAQPNFLALEHPTVSVHDSDTGQLVATGLTDADAFASGSPAFASFGSQPWVAPLGPFLDFAPQPVYEPTGELVHEQIQTIEEFDAPSSTTITPSARLRSGVPVPVSSVATTSTSTTVDVAVAANDPRPVNVFVPPSLPRSALKRKAPSTEASSNEGDAPKLQRPGPVANNARSVSFERMSGIRPTSPDEGSTSSDLLSGSRSTAQNTAAPGNQRRTRQSAASTPRTTVTIPSATTQAARRSNRGTRPPSGHPPSILPPEKVFPIQIGSDLFRLSGASISSDAPSYFTQFFEEQIRQNEESGGVRTLYIDRDPATFRDVARHLQGYYVKPVDGSHFVKLFADAQFYSLPRLIDQLFESEIFIQIGERHFQIPKDIFSEPGNSPNFFSLGFAVFFSTPGEVFPGLDRRGLLRPPSITPPYVPGRSAEVFAELLHLLRGYPLHIRNEAHRAELLRDCRYFHLRGLEQKIIAHEISYNLERQKTEICLRLEDVKPSGVSFNSDDFTEEQPTTGGWVYYARPFVDDTSYELVVEIGGETTVLDLTDMRADFHGLAKARVSSLFQVVANKMNLPTNAPLGLMMLSGGPSSQSASPGHTPLSEDRVKVQFEHATYITLDGEPYDIDWESPLGQVMAHGPSTAPNESGSESDIMTEPTSSRAGSQVPAGGQQRRPQTRQAHGGGPHPSAPPRPSLAAPPLQTSRLSSMGPASKKRKRQSSHGEFGEWTIRTGQWRLRVQPNPQDSIRGGFEIVFMGVRIEAYSSERARNARRGFLS